MKIIITMVSESDVSPEALKAYYEADTLEQAVKNQQAWIDEGACDLHDILDGDVVATVTGVA